jgi:hypothetical protein
MTSPIDKSGSREVPEAPASCICSVVAGLVLQYGWCDVKEMPSENLVRQRRPGNGRGADRRVGP